MSASVTLWEATAPVKLPTRCCPTTGSRPGLGPKPDKGGISRLPPPRPESRVQRLPPILRMPSPDATPGYSKAPRGLFVRLRGGCIFTANSISPGSSLRQRPSRYAIRAGRNLPDKEFRYLRTVIVTAAVHRGFSSQLLKPLPLTFRHRAGVTPYMSPSGLAGSCVFGKQSHGPVLCARLALHGLAASRYRGTPSPEVTGSTCLVP